MDSSQRKYKRRCLISLLVVSEPSDQRGGRVVEENSVLPESLKMSIWMSDRVVITDFPMFIDDGIRKVLGRAVGKSESSLGNVL